MKTTISVYGSYSYDFEVAPIGWCVRYNCNIYFECGYTYRCVCNLNLWKYN